MVKSLEFPLTNRPYSIQNTHPHRVDKHVIQCLERAQMENRNSYANPQNEPHPPSDRDK